MPTMTEELAHRQNRIDRAARAIGFRVLRPGIYHTPAETYVELHPHTDDQAITLSHIKTPRHLRGLGYASQALKMVEVIADRAGWTVYLSAESYDPDSKPRLTDRQVRAWYRRHGFKRTKNKKDEMRRKPRR